MFLHGVGCRASVTRCKPAIVTLVPKPLRPLALSHSPGRIIPPQALSPWPLTINPQSQSWKDCPPSSPKPLALDPKPSVKSWKDYPPSSPKALTSLRQIIIPLVWIIIHILRTQPNCLGHREAHVRIFTHLYARIPITRGIRYRRQEAHSTIQPCTLITVRSPPLLDIPDFWGPLEHPKVQSLGLVSPHSLASAL